MHLMVNWLNLTKHPRRFGASAGDQSPSAAVIGLSSFFNQVGDLGTT
jgi:hypothetical protein